MVDSLEELPPDQIDEVFENCRLCAKAIIDNWPKAWANKWAGEESTKHDLHQFPYYLLKLHDSQLISQFLRRIHEQDAVMPLGKFLLACCEEFGWITFQAEMRQFFVADNNERGDRSICLRDLSWLSTLAKQYIADVEFKLVIQAIASQVVGRLALSLETLPNRNLYVINEIVANVKGCLELLLELLLVLQDQSNLQRMIGLIRQNSQHFSIEEYQLPLVTKIYTKQSLLTKRPASELMDWLQTIRSHLERVTAKQPVPPSDWSRKAEVICSCQHCKYLNEFLAHPTENLGTIKAVQSVREHVVNHINTFQCDINHRTIKVASPYTLVLEKNSASYLRDVDTYQLSLKLLAEMPQIEG